MNQCLYDCKICYLDGYDHRVILPGVNTSEVLVNKGDVRHASLFGATDYVYTLNYPQVSLSG